MGKLWTRKRRMTVDGQEYIYSIVDHREDRELRVYRRTERVPLLCLHLTWPETWGIDLFRPKAVACVIGWWEGSGRKAPAVLILSEELELLGKLLDLFFPPEERAQREWFLGRIGDTGR